MEFNEWYNGLTRRERGAYLSNFRGAYKHLSWNGFWDTMWHMEEFVEYNEFEESCEDIARYENNRINNMEARSI